LIVERKNGDIEIHPIEKMGLRMVPFGDLYLKEVRVPVGNRLGDEGEGMAHVHYHHQVKGLRNVAQALGMAQGALDRTIKYSKQREQFGRKLSQFQVTQHKVADMAVSIEVARWLAYRSAIECNQGKTDHGFLSMAQLEVGRRLVQVVDDALQIFGGYGYIAEQAVEHYFRDAWAMAVELGTEEELKDVIAEGLLGPLNK
jgi:alkylation response protein AidB-like acyl-CoA dehydrogenase